jgi:hypothetical protein
MTHAEHEQSIVMGALRRSLPPQEYQRLAGTYAAEKVRALGMWTTMEPSRRPLTR